MVEMVLCRKQMFVQLYNAQQLYYLSNFITSN